MYDLACIFSMSGRLYSDIPTQGYFSSEYTFKTCPHSCVGSTLANFKCVYILYIQASAFRSPILGCFFSTWSVSKIKIGPSCICLTPVVACSNVASVLYCRALQVFNMKGSPLKLPKFFRCKDLIKPLQSRNRF